MLVLKLLTEWEFTTYDGRLFHNLWSNQGNKSFIPGDPTHPNSV